MSWDLYLLELVNRRLANPLLDAIMGLLTIAVIPGVLIVPMLPWCKNRRQRATMWIAVLLATFLSVGIQFVLRRPRPTGVRLVIPTPSFPSFPSGHAAALFACAALSALFWPRTWLPAFSVAGIGSLSRVYLGQHYPSDVFAGMIVGIATALVIYGLVYSPAREKRPRWAWLLWGQVAVALLATLGAYLDLLHLAFLTLSGVDKLFHFLLPGALSFFAVGWWAQRSKKAVLGALSVLAIVEEMLQSFSTVRSFDLVDLAATLFGILLFGLISAKVSRGLLSPDNAPHEIATTGPHFDA